MVAKYIRRAMVVVLVATVGVVSSGRGQSDNSASARAVAQVPTPQFASEPAGAGRCLVCHRAEVEGYARSAMAHSLRSAGREPDGVVNAGNVKISMHSSPSGYWQRWQSGADAINYRIDYVIGSGNHASSYLLDLAGHLFESPVTYYKTRHTYDLTPGYEGIVNPDFTRPVAEGCLFCHAGTALPISGTANRYQSPPFSAEAITCERCHGSAEKHLNDPRAGTIVNPAKLEPGARDSVCEQCHLLGVGRVINPGKKFSDFRPGQHLEDVFTTYRYALPAGAETGEFKVISHVEQLARSACARKSDSKLWCGTCHDPHSKPLEPIAYYRSKCLSCHTENFPASHAARDSNCIGCHMPRRDAKDGGHTAFTDHRIQRRPQPQPAESKDLDIAAWREPALDLRKRNLGIAYVDVGTERHSSSFVIRGYGLLTEVQHQFSNDTEVFASLGSALLLAKQTSEAELAFGRSLQLAPESADAESNAASAYLQAGDVDSAVAHLERAVALDPLHLQAAAPLIEIYRQQGALAKATELSEKIKAAMASSDKIAEEIAPHSSSQKAKVVFKNIQVLKEVSADQLLPAMRFMTASLGVECSYCHVPDHFDKDDKKPKQTAREMMRMMLTIDKNSFESDRQVTCYSCHRGSLKPLGVPVVGEPRPAQEAGNLSTNLPTADDVIDHYVQAVGGAAVIEKITSRDAKGTVTTGSESIGIEILDQDPKWQVSIRHTPAGDSLKGFNGHEGWLSTPGRPLRDIQGVDLDFALMDADLHFPVHMKYMFAELRVEYPEKIGDREAYVISGMRPGQPTVKFYFDEQSGLLLRLVRYAESPLGLVPTRIDYADYRDVDGVQVPFRWTIAEPDASSIIQLDETQQNVPIDGSRFVKPRS
jgi:photosynthetic reaction center cytochrome c subunit